MEYYKTKGGMFVKGNEQHVLIVSEEGEIDNSGNCTLKWCKENYKMHHITRQEFDKNYKEVVEGLNQFMAL